jgi:hypothetical protein
LPDRPGGDTRSLSIIGIFAHREVSARYEQANSKRVKMSAQLISTSGDKSFASLRLFLGQAGHLRLRPRSVLVGQRCSVWLVIPVRLAFSSVEPAGLTSLNRAPELFVLLNVEP